MSKRTTKARASAPRNKAANAKSRAGRAAALRPAPNPLVAAFASAFNAWRRKKGVPLKMVARDLDVSIAVVWAWENGARFPSVDHLQAIAEYTGVPASSLLKL